jgi:sensor histidine kinase YesM
MEKEGQKGFIGLLIVLIVSIVFLKYVFDFNLVEFLKSPKVLEVLSYIKRFFVLIWDKFLVGPAIWIWDNIVIDIIWKILKNGFEILKGWVDTESS